jgi:OmpA-OmpF porin, OOP family
MMRTLAGILLLASFDFCFGQSPEFLALGKITDARTNKGVKADIRYSSIPTGSIYGHFNDSTFEFTIFGTARYQVTVQAQGYNPKTVIVDPKDISADNRVFRNIQLVPKGETIVLDHLIFAQGDAKILTESFTELDEVVQMMQENQRIEIQLEGHTDNVGSPKANLELSEKRVEAVKKYLVSKGINKNRIKTRAFGGSQPIHNQNGQQARNLNRRVEMRVLKD